MCIYCLIYIDCLVHCSRSGTVVFIFSSCTFVSYCSLYRILCISNYIVDYFLSELYFALFLTGYVAGELEATWSTVILLELQDLVHYLDFIYGYCILDFIIVYFILPNLSPDDFVSNDLVDCGDFWNVYRCCG
ncbi:hypothetical protein M6B38_118180 [Iris pallida]|uniref:Uncharacterized protein n=1 Tax=Iris pallida TaxID=29817 RepID=A0AAX6HJI1_IRIPA|nr:hypothetical protein M6B38_118170 [Iris pallida]KAJ6840694.1 hypothetical protein M6B38_118180 [Iris pallida]